MILYSPASYFLCIIVVQIIKEPIFLWDICDFFYRMLAKNHNHAKVCRKLIFFIRTLYHAERNFRNLFSQLASGPAL